MKQFLQSFSNEINLVHEKVSIKDRELILGPFTDDDGPFVEFNDSHTTMAHLMYLAGCFPSISQGRKNGWNKPIPIGYQKIIFGKNKFEIYILNQF